MHVAISLLKDFGSPQQTLRGKRGESKAAAKAQSGYNQLYAPQKTLVTPRSSDTRRKQWKALIDSEWNTVFRGTWTYCSALLGLGDAQQLVSQQRLLQHSVVADADGDERDVIDLAFEEGLQHHVHHACRQCRGSQKEASKSNFIHLENLPM